MTSAPGSRSPEERDRYVESMVLLEIVALHPDHLTVDELLVRMEDDPGDMDRLAIRDAIASLMRCGLVRLTGEIIEPTHPAVCMTAIFDLLPAGDRAKS